VPKPVPVFTKKSARTFLRIDPAKCGLRTGGGKADDLVGRILKEKDPVKRMKALHDATNPQAQFLWAIFRDMFHYIAVHLESVADNARDIDFALRWGFGWSSGPFETWQAAGWQQVATWVKEDIDAGKALEQCAVAGMGFRRAGCEKCRRACVEDGSWSPTQKKNVPRSTLPVYQAPGLPCRVSSVTRPPNGSTAGTTVFEDESVRIWHQDDEVLVLSFKTKMHVIGAGVTGRHREGYRRRQRQNYKGLVIWHADAAEGGAFSAGADLQSMLPLFMSGGVKAIEPEWSSNCSKRIRRSSTPTCRSSQQSQVMALGGGCEMLLHAAKRVASIESYIGLVEVGVGLIPGGGGLKEIAVRAANDAKGNDILQFLKDYYMHAQQRQPCRVRRWKRSNGLSEE
jgi:3-hydroxyacyl-CoA dehydrogenase